MYAKMLRWWDTHHLSPASLFGLVVEQLLIVTLMLFALQGVAQSEAQLYTAIFMVSLFISMIGMTEVYLCTARFLYLYELEYASNGSLGWRRRLKACWFSHILGVWFVWPILSMRSMNRLIAPTVPVKVTARKVRRV